MDSSHDPRDRPGGARGRSEVLVVADPGLPLELARRMEGRPGPEVTVLCRRLPADDLEQIRTPADVDRSQRQVAVMLTDHPRREHVRPIAAEVHLGTRTAVVSLPSLGAVRLRRRATEAVERAIGELSGQGGGDRLGPFLREETPAGVRFATGGRHGRLRILAGMVRANRPWRLLPHLSKAFAAALAVLAYAILNPTIWELARSLDVGRMALAFVLAIVTMVAWLIVDHRMWERPDGDDQRELATLFNVVTVATLLIGVLLLYAGLVAIGLVADRVVVDDRVMSSAIGQPAGLGQHLALVWLASTTATVAGAVGTGFESDAAVRQAAYGYRQRERLELEAERRGDERHRGPEGGGATHR